MQGYDNHRRVFINVWMKQIILCRVLTKLVTCKFENIELSKSLERADIKHSYDA